MDTNKFNHNLEMLKTMLSDGTFHHATDRNIGPSLWNGWYIYKKETNGFNNFVPTCSFCGATKEQEAQVYELVRSTGYSLGSYGKG